MVEPTKTVIDYYKASINNQQLKLYDADIIAKFPIISIRLLYITWLHWINIDSNVFAYLIANAAGIVVFIKVYNELWLKMSNLTLIQI